MEKTGRIVLFDNVKALLILLVVIGHFVEPYIGQSHGMKALWIFIYSFHMPLFLFISGLMHKGYKTEDGLNRYRVAALLICGYIYRIVIGLVNMTLAGGGTVSFKLLDSGGYITWFVMVLAMYELIAYFFRGMKSSIVIIAAILLSIFVGYDSSIGDLFDLSRAIVFFPFYLFGYYLQPQLVSEWTDKQLIKLLSAAILLGYVAVCFIGTDWIYQYRGLFTGRNPFEIVAKKLPDITFLSRVFTMLISTTVGASVISLTPNKRISLASKIGTRTLQIYFWHFPIFCVLSKIQFYEKTCMFFGMRLGKAVFVLSAVICTVSCSLPLFSHPTDDILKIRQPGSDEVGVRKWDK